MSDDPTKKGPADSSKINMHEEYEVRYWTEKFGVTKDRLQMAVDKVGNSAEKVKAALGKGGRP
jgi:hypothetical protein